MCCVCVRVCVWAKLGANQSIMHNGNMLRTNCPSRWCLYSIVTYTQISGGFKLPTCQIILSYSYKISDHKSDFLI